MKRLAQQKVTSSHNRWRGPNTLGPLVLESLEEESHGSHRVVAPMTTQSTLHIGRVHRKEILHDMYDIIFRQC